MTKEKQSLHKNISVDKAKIYFLKDKLLSTTPCWSLLVIATMTNLNKPRFVSLNILVFIYVYIYSLISSHIWEQYLAEQT